jgi:hypothetical protein
MELEREGRRRRERKEDQETRERKSADLGGENRRGVRDGSARFDLEALRPSLKLL